MRRTGTHIVGPRGSSLACSAAVLAVLAGPAQAAPNDPLFDGVWCGEAGMFFVNPWGVGFNEHTICEVDLPIAPMAAAGGAYVSPMACANVYVTEIHEDGSVDTVELPLEEFHEITLIPHGADELHVDLSRGPIDIYTRCDAEPS